MLRSLEYPLGFSQEAHCSSWGSGWGKGFSVCLQGFASGRTWVVFVVLAWIDWNGSPLRAMGRETLAANRGVEIAEFIHGLSEF